MKKKKQPKKPSKPTKKLAPPAEVNKADWLGSMKGTFQILEDIVAPASDEDDWEVLRD